MKIKNLPNDTLCEALRYCASADFHCDICPIEGNDDLSFTCSDELINEAARRLDHLTEITAQRDAMDKQLKKLGIEV